MTRFRSLLAGLLLIAFAAPAARAQSAAAPTENDSRPAAAATAATVATVAGPTIDGAIAGVRAPRTDADSAGTLARQQGPGFGRAETLMIVGGAAFIAGLIIGDDAGTVVMVAGAGVGLYGLYLYLQTQ